MKKNHGWRGWNVEDGTMYIYSNRGLNNFYKDMHNIKIKSNQEIDYTKDIIKVVISEGINIINDSGFYYLRNLQSVHLPTTLKIIGEAAFRNCIRLSNINLPNNLERICTEAFGNCCNLMQLHIPSNCYVEKNAFFNYKITDFMNNL